MCEAIAVNSSVLVHRKDVNRLQAILTVLVARHDDVESAGIRHDSGKRMVAVGDHRDNWKMEAGDESDDAQVFVLIMNGKDKRGGLEIRFQPLHGDLLYEAVHNPWVRLTAFVAACCAISWYFYLGKVLEQLNPSHAVPVRVRSALDTLAEGLLVLDRKGRIVLCNQALVDTLGIDPPTLIGKNARTLPWQRDESEAEDDYPWERTLAGDTRHTVGETIKLTDASGAEHIYQTNCSPVLGAKTEVRGVVCSFEDVTELEAQKSELADSRAEAQAANEAKSAFLANMSHEIRTPMNAILGFTEVLRQGMFGTPEQQAEYLETNHRSSKHLLHLINDILDLSKVEADQLKMECIPCSPHQLLHDVATVLQVQGDEDKCIAAGCSHFLSKPVDLDKLQHLLAELLGAVEIDPTKSVSVSTQAPAPATPFISILTADGDTPDGNASTMSATPSSSCPTMLEELHATPSSPAFAIPDSPAMAMPNSEHAATAINLPSANESQQAPLNAAANAESAPSLDHVMNSVQQELKEQPASAATALAQTEQTSEQAEARMNHVCSQLPLIVSTLPTDDAEFCETVVGFVEKLKQEVQKLSEAWERRDLKEVATLAHWLKGAAGTVGFRELTNRARS